MGLVYRARHRLMNRSVALKVIARHLLANTQALGRFRREIEAAALLKHPHIVVAFDAEQAGALHFLVTEFIEGESLDQVVTREGPLPIAKAATFALHVALGLEHAAEKGMVHRDIKPQNLMLATDGNVKILDFGLARLAAPLPLPVPVSPERAAEIASPDFETVEYRPPAGEAPGGVSLTQPGAFVGTPDFVAPEQVGDSRNVDIRTDLYSLGCTLYFLLTARPPFPGGGAVHKLAAHLRNHPRPLRELRPDVPPGLEAIVVRLMEKQPSRRYATPSEVVAALRPFAAAPATGPAATLRRWSALAFADRRKVAKATVALALGSLLTFALWPKAGEPKLPEPLHVAAVPQAQANTPPQVESTAPASPTIRDRISGAVDSASNLLPPVPGGGKGSASPLVPMPSSVAPLLPPRESIRDGIRDRINGGIDFITDLLPPPPASLTGNKPTNPPQGNPPNGNAGAGERPTGPPPANPPYVDPRVDSSADRPLEVRDHKFLLIVPSKDVWYFDYFPLRAELAKPSADRPAPPPGHNAPNSVVITAGVKKGTAPYMPGEGTINGRVIKAPTSGVTIQRELSEIDMDEFAAVVFIGADISEFVDDGPGAKETERILKDAWRLTRPIASICVSTKILAKHGFLRGLPAARGDLLPPGSVGEDDALWDRASRIVMASGRKPSVIFTAADDADAYELAHSLIRFHAEYQVPTSGTNATGVQGGQNGTPQRPGQGGFGPRPGGPGGPPNGPIRQLPR